MELAGLVCVICLVVIGVLTPTCLRTRRAKNANSSSSADVGASPTLLSLVDPTSGNYLVALNNPLYNLVSNSTISLLPPNSTDGLPVLELDKTQIYQTGESLTLSWQRLSDHVQEDDILTLYCDDALLEAATIAQAQATSAQNGGTSPFEWYMPYFPVTKYSACQFWHYQNQASNTSVQDQGSAVSARSATPTNTANQPKFVPRSASPVIEVYTADKPTQIHLALGDTPTTMVVHFETGAVGTPVAVYDLSYPPTKYVVAGTSQTYTANDMCGSPANLNQVGYFEPPGQLHLVEMTKLEPDTTYYYKVGLGTANGMAWSDIIEFRSPPLVGANELREPFSYVVYADQGCPNDRWGNEGNWSAAMVNRELLHYNCRAVHHIGDLSYANGAAHLWDAWMGLIEPFTSRLPFMIAIGNHVSFLEPCMIVIVL